MTPPHLIITCGFPCAGKSAVSSYLMKHHGFARLKADAMREQVYGETDYPEYFAQPDGPMKEDRLIRMMQLNKRFLLAEGVNVVYDATASYDVMRRFLLDTTWGDGVIPARKTLFYLQCSDDKIRERNLAKGRTNDVVGTWREYWTEPNPEEFPVVTCRAETNEDFVTIFTTLDTLVIE